MILLVPAVLALAWFQVHAHRRALGFAALSRRGSLVVAFAVVEGVLLGVTELASIDHHLHRTSIGAAWAIAAVVLGATSARRLVALVRTRPVRRLSAWADHLDLEAALLLALMAAAGVILVGMAIAYPPSNTDSLMYHLPRVEHWIQNSSVAHFSAHYLSQIEFSPLHEFNLLHVHLLADSDRMDGFVQLLAAGVAVVGVSEVARLLGGGRRAQLISAFVAAAAPSVILEATSTQNNDFAGAVAIALFVALLAWRPGPGWVPRSLVIGALGGLAVLTKGSLVVMIAPAAVAVAVVVLRRDQLAEATGAFVRRAGAAVGLVVLAALAAAAPFLLRNHEVFDSFTGPDSKLNISKDLGPRAAVANVVRATSTNFRIGDEQGLDGLVSRLAFDTLRPIFDLTDVAGDDPRYRIGADTRAFEPDSYSVFQRVEEYGANPWHVLLLLSAGVATVLAATVGRRRDLGLTALLAIGLAVGFVAFTALNRWSPFAIRYQVPLLLGWSAVIGVALARIPKWLAQAVLVGLTVAAVGPLLKNFARPMVDPTFPFDTYLDGYYAGGAAAIGAPLEEFDDVARRLADSDCRTLGITNWVAIEYPLWVALDHHGWDGHIEQLNVANASSQLIPTDFEPCATLRQEADPATDVPQIHLVLELEDDRR